MLEFVFRIVFESVTIVSLEQNHQTCRQSVLDGDDRDVNETIALDSKALVDSFRVFVNSNSQLDDLLSFVHVVGINGSERVCEVSHTLLCRTSLSDFGNNSAASCLFSSAFSVVAGVVGIGVATFAGLDAMSESLFESMMSPFLIYSHQLMINLITAQIKSNQIKSNQIKSNQIKSTQITLIM